jgi:hypothetical protein
MAGQGIVGVGTSGEGCRVVVERSSPLLQRRLQLLSIRAPVLADIVTVLRIHKAYCRSRL